MLKVVKFGGSSLADADHFRKAAEIVKAESSRHYVIPSAPGKRFKDDDKVTDLLYSCYDAANLGENIDDAFEKIENRYRDIIKELGISLSLEDEFQVIRDSFMHKAGRDYAASRGEYLNGLIMAHYLGCEFIDAADVIFFRDDGTFDAERTNTILGQCLREHDRAVIPGFYGSMPNDTIKTFSRGGSDITGSIVARASMCDIYENWTDVSGFMMADPRIVDNPKPIDVITYRELRELAYMGAGVLHEEAIFPVRFAGIPINIRNTNDPSAAGTMIVPDAPAGDRIVTGIAGKKGFSVITVDKELMNTEIGFGRRLLSVLEREKINFEHLPSGIDTMSVVVATPVLQGRRDRIIDELCDMLNPDSIHIEDHLALIAVVGRGMKAAKGTAARVFTSISEADINIKMIDQGSSELNIIVGVKDDDFEKTMKVIYEEFVEG
jgi:aspartate kinase